MTQSAITRQIASLERELGAKLFHRGRRGVELTREGEAFRLDISPAFERIELAAVRFKDRREGDVLRVRAYPTFAAQWLMPRLFSFVRWAPDVRLEITTGVDPVNFDRNPVDAAIQFLARSRVPNGAEELFGDEIEPVCSPEFVADRSGRLDLSDLTNMPVIQARYRRADWRDWSASQGLAEFHPQPRFEFPSSMLVYRATLLGLGLAMGQIPLLDQELRNGTLVRPFGCPTRRDMAYYLLLPEHREPSRKVRLFATWLHSEVARASS